MAIAYIEVPVYCRVGDSEENQLGVISFEPDLMTSAEARDHVVVQVQARAAEFFRDIAHELGGTRSFQRDLRDLINRHSVDNDANTADYILARYLHRCLEAFTEAVEVRDRHSAPPSRDVLLGQAAGIERRV
ncbi:hypothetical protein [Amycolatopsis thermophila]|uniref:Uncharacterized protein n=1 Tax=Amycolatopsis thermophila TaxID=206084 RepID=A0ABU0EN51_9PSEU|nr:hypothetical protein [Amycolatopsis thermophila]MDQ0376599.1 hypothetical protein [Amycolatopsis thermophila]